MEYVSSSPELDFLGVARCLSWPRVSKVKTEHTQCQVVVLGYGQASEAPEDLPSTAVLRPGDVTFGGIELIELN